MSNETTEEVREEFLHGTDRQIRYRRGIITLSLFSTAVLSGVALFQIGVLRKLPDPPLPYFNAEKVHGSLDAYLHFGIPDALLGVASYAATACLAGMGGTTRLLAGKALVDAGVAGQLTVKEWRRFHSFSLWSLLVSAATFTALPLALKSAWHR